MPRAEKYFMIIDGEISNRENEIMDKLVEIDIKTLRNDSNFAVYWGWLKALCNYDYAFNYMMENNLNAKDLLKEFNENLDKMATTFWGEEKTKELNDYLAKTKEEKNKK
jgi:hypothetical protein